MKNIKILFLFFVGFLLLISCTKQPVKLFNFNGEPKKPTGLNHFYFYKIKNGHKRLMVAKTTQSDLGALYDININDTAGEYRQGTLITANRGHNLFFDNSKNVFRFEIFLFGGINRTGTYSITDTDFDTNGIGSLYFTQLNQNQVFADINGLYVSKAHSGNVTITYLSTDKKEFKGNFNLTLYNYFQPDDSIQIKDGHFWINKDSL